MHPCKKQIPLSSIKLRSLNVNLIANPDNLELIQKPAEVINSNLANLICFPSLTTDFPQNTEIPIYLYGDKVSHEAIEDCGIVIGSLRIKEDAIAITFVF